MSALVALECADDPAAWAALGLPADFIEFVDHGTGLTGWILSGDGPPAIDGIPTSWTQEVPDGSFLHLDHVVVMTDDVERTVAAMVDAGADERRRKRPPEVPVPMAFVKLGDAVIEVAQGGGPTRLWGLTVVVDDLDRLDPALVGPAKDAVQPGRRIATVRREAGLQTAVAFMTPRVRAH
jgi:hypothetical protein